MRRIDVDGMEVSTRRWEGDLEWDLGAGRNKDVLTLTPSVCMCAEGEGPVGSVGELSSSPSPFLSPFS